MKHNLLNFFGKEYAINESLVYSLQFSHLRTNQQIISNKAALSKDLTDIVNYIEMYRTALSDNVYNSQEYSIKLIQIPKISNTNRADAAIEFVKWNEIKDEDKAVYEQICVLIKDKKVMVEAANVGKLKPGEVLAKVNENYPQAGLKMHLHTSLCKVFSIRPPAKSDDPFDTNTEFCHYDEAHNDYLYQETWVTYLTNLFQAGVVTATQIVQAAKNNEKLDIDKYRITE